MGKDYRIRLVLPAAILVGLLVLLATGPGEPVHGGKRLSAWLKDLKLGAGASTNAPAAAEAVRQIGTNALPNLMARLRAEDSELWLFCVNLLESQSVIQFRFRRAFEYHREAIEGFRALGPAASPIIPKIEALVDNPDMVITAFQALSAIGPDAAPALVRLLGHRDEDVRAMAIDALRDCPSQAPLAVPALARLLHNPSRGVRLKVVSALARLGPMPGVTVPALIGALRDPDPAMHDSVLDALAGFGPVAKPAIPSIEGLLADAKPTFLYQVVSACARIDPPTAMRLLRARFQAPEATTRARAIQAFRVCRRLLSVQNQMELVPELIAALKDPDAQVRLEGVNALRELGRLAESAGPELSRLAKDDPDPRVRTAAGDWMSRADVFRRTYGVAVPGLPPAFAPVVPQAVGDKRIALLFSGHEFAEGGETILNQLAKHHAKASFFLTGDSLDNPQFKSLVQRIVGERHYLGPHSDKHLLLCSWDESRKTLVTQEQFVWDLWLNRAKIEAFGPRREGINYFLPPYEHSNPEIAAWTLEMGLTLINFTPGTRSHADYTEDGATNFVSSRAILDSIITREQQDTNGLNGFKLLMHIGAGPRRTDKLHDHLGELLDYLAGRGYEYVRLDELNRPRLAESGILPPSGTPIEGWSDEARVRFMRVYGISAPGGPSGPPPAGPASPPEKK